MRGTQISAVNAGAFEAVTYQGMQAMGKNLGLEAKQIQGMYEQFAAQFREMTSAIPNLDVPARSLQTSSASQDTVHHGGVPIQRGGDIGRA